MDAIIGRYRVNIEELEPGLILKHPAGINFDLTPEEALGLLDFINVYKQTLIAMDNEREHNCDTEPHLERIILIKENNEGK